MYIYFFVCCIPVTNDSDLITKLNNNKNEPKIDENVKSKLNLLYVYNTESLEYIESDLIELNIKTGVVFRDARFNNKKYIPQVDNINLGLYISGYTVEGYQYENSGVVDLNRVNINDYIIEVMSDDQKNTNLPKQLDELHTYLRNLNQYNEKSQGQKIIRDFEYTNHWVNDILQYNLVDIYKNAYNNNVQFFTGLIDSLNKIIDSNQQNKSLKDDDIKKITNNYLEYKKFILRG
ncbi:hypothetical protein BCR32DRAFT_284772 [Anaeromyces robustus]|uniref:Uncharacterized protein n=1 Tax=Anaeromyces robustus TaxID=1754192 RepID=A0A1Y1WRX6_9FUNG|nr:hypothetical protein BCR32DRAFT_284772 [Anaeromyces robustus]|eukprot:ORX75874.1 hypothetical protein BCR32DRAFT_284772 [Anaeromyces robustus]